MAGLEHAARYDRDVRRVLRVIGRETWWSLTVELGFEGWEVGAGEGLD